MTEPGSIHCDEVYRIYRTAGAEVVALQGLDLHVAPGELITVVGASGSGKSTLLRILGGLDQPTAGSVHIGGRDLARFDDAMLDEHRRSTVGFVWQQTSRNLLAYLDARSNIEFPLSLAGWPRRERRARADELLDLVGMSHRATHRPSEMSGGEQQRIAIATALANRPQVLLADEPTGELDAATAAEIVGVITQVNVELGVTGVLVTHDPLLSRRVGRTVAIRDGRISTEVVRDHTGAEVVESEYAVLDAAGRVQLPREYVDALDLQRRVHLDLEPGHVVMRPPARDGEAQS